MFQESYGLQKSKLLHVAYHYNRRKKCLTLSKLYEINHVEQMDIYNMYTLLCIIYNDHHLMHCTFCYVKFWKSWLCSRTTATSRKQVTHCLYVAVFSLILIPRLSRHLHENCYTWYLWRLNVHDICCVRLGTGVSELCPFLKLVSI